MKLERKFWIKKTERRDTKDAKKDEESEVLIITMVEASGANITLKGSPDTLEWLESGRDVDVCIELASKQSSLTEASEKRVKGEEQSAETVHEGEFRDEFEE